MTVPQSLYSYDFTGMPVDAAAKLLGKTRHGALNWLKDRGYRMTRERKLTRTRTADDVAEEIRQRIQSMRPQTNCFYCGARGECAHR